MRVHFKFTVATMSFTIVMAGLHITIMRLYMAIDKIIYGDD